MTTEADAMTWEEVDHWLTDDERAAMSSSTEVILRELAAHRRAIWVFSNIEQNASGLGDSWMLVEGTQTLFRVEVTQGMALSIECPTCGWGGKRPDGSDQDIGDERVCHSLRKYAVGIHRPERGLHLPRYVKAAQIMVRRKLFQMAEEDEDQTEAGKSRAENRGVPWMKVDLVYDATKSGVHKAKG